MSSNLIVSAEKTVAEKAIGNLLVVDDNEINRDMLSRRLLRKGYQVQLAEDGRRAIEMISKENFDLILLDIEMPEMDGMEVLRIVRANYSASKLPIIMVTAKVETEDIVGALKIGANDYVTKPIDFPVVLARVRTQLSLKHAQDALDEANKRMKSDLERAAAVQQGLLPSEHPDAKGVSFAWKYRPCDELAGDSLNVFQLNDRYVGMYVLDVSGHGVSSALLSFAVTRQLSIQNDGSSILASDIGDEMKLVSPAEVLSRLNQLYPMTSNGMLYFTVLYGLYDTEQKTLRYACGGHPGPLLLHKHGAGKLLDEPSRPIGMLEDSVFEERTIQLAAGDRVVFYSDGLYEERNPYEEQFSKERLQRSFEKNSASALAECIDLAIREVVQWKNSEDLSDDVTLLALEVLDEYK